MMPAGNDPSVIRKMSVRQHWFLFRTCVCVCVTAYQVGNLITSGTSSPRRPASVAPESRRADHVEDGLLSRH